MDTDAELLARWTAGEEAAFQALYTRWARRVHRYLCLLLGRARASWAEDCLQETFLRIQRHAASYDARQPFQPWLFGIARHEAMRLHRREGPRSAQPLPEGLPASQGAEDPGLEEALSALPEAVRSAVLLVHLERMGRREAALALGISERSVQALCHQGFGQLRKILKKA